MVTTVVFDDANVTLPAAAALAAGKFEFDAVIFVSCVIVFPVLVRAAPLIVLVGTVPKILFVVEAASNGSWLLLVGVPATVNVVGVVNKLVVANVFKVDLLKSVFCRLKLVVGPIVLVLGTAACSSFETVGCAVVVVLSITVVETVVSVFLSNDPLLRN